MHYAEAIQTNLMEEDISFLRLEQRNAICFARNYSQHKTFDI